MSAYVIKSRQKAHGVRNRQSEYVGHEQKNVSVLEMFCGRKVREDDTTVVTEVTCGTCVKSIKKMVCK